MKILFAGALVALAVFASTAGASAEQLAPGLVTKACTVGPKWPARCGTFTTYEHREKNSGATVTMAVTVVRAAHPSDVAIAEIAGGPGQAASDLVKPVVMGLVNSWVRPLHATHDVIFLDARGMGKYGFGCHWDDRGDPAAYMAQLFPDKSVARCLAQNAGRDRATYTTPNAIDDLDQLRAKLGYRKLILDGGSYGTYFALQYMRRHPRSVAAAILDGVDAPGFQALPGTPDGVQHALDDTLAACERDATCHAHYSDPRRDFAGVLAHFDAGPWTISFQDPFTGKTITAALTKEVFVDRLRQLMYDPQTAAAVPFIMHEAVSGNTVPLGNAISQTTVGFGEALDMGAFLSYSCAEWIPALDPARVAAAAASSFAGDLRIAAQRAACKTWNVPAAPKAFVEPVHSTLPALLITGSDDPATPPASAAQALHDLPNAREVLVTGGGHGNDSPCIRALVVAFVAAGSARGLDVHRCSVARPNVTFYTEMPRWLKP